MAGKLGDEGTLALGAPAIGAGAGGDGGEREGIVVFGLHGAKDRHGSPV
ncbi:hypothetical protein [Sphingomonas sp. 22176]